MAFKFRESTDAGSRQAFTHSDTICFAEIRLFFP